MKALLLAAFLGCSTPLAFRVDPAIDSTDVQSEAAKWNGITSPGNEITVDVNGSWLITEGDTPHDTAGWCHRGERLIVLDSERGYSQTRPAVLHELGHALGLHHTTRGVMGEHEIAAEFSAEDLEECRNVGACR